MAFMLQEVIHCKLHQHVVPQVCAVDPVGGERLLGAVSQRCQGLVRQRGASVGQPLSALLLLALLVQLLVDRASAFRCASSACCASSRACKA